MKWDNRPGFKTEIWTPNLAIQSPNMPSPTWHEIRKPTWHDITHMDSRQRFEPQPYNPKSKYAICTWHEMRKHTWIQDRDLNPQPYNPKSKYAITHLTWYEKTHLKWYDITHMDSRQRFEPTTLQSKVQICHHPPDMKWENPPDMIWYNPCGFKTEIWTPTLQSKVHICHHLPDMKWENPPTHLDSRQRFEPLTLHSKVQYNIMLSSAWHLETR